MKVSVIVPVYNAEKTIERTISALIAQTFLDFEVLLIDNGSIDRTSEICLKYQQIDKRFRYIYTEQKGVSNARNIGLECAEGIYICFCDADDIPAENMLQVMLEDMEQYQTDCVMCNYYTERDECKSSFPFETNIILDSKMIRMKMIPAMFACKAGVTAVWGTVWRCIFKKSLIQDIKLEFDTRLTFAEDLCFVIEYFSFAKKIYIEDKVLYHYSMTEGSAMLSFYKYKPWLAEERIYLIKKLSFLLKKIQIYEYLKEDVETIFQEYILECIGNATVRSKEHSMFEAYLVIRNIVSDKCVESVFKKIYTKDNKHKIVFKMIQLKMSLLLTLYYCLRKG